MPSIDFSKVNLLSTIDSSNYPVKTFEPERFASLPPMKPARIDRGPDVLQACSTVDPTFVARTVRAIAHEEGFDEDLAEAVAWAESDLGKNQGPSSAGALGIMQLMPGTAGDLGVRDRCDTQQNIRGGIRYLKQLHGEFNDPLLMLAAYNAGAGNVYKANGIPANAETSKYIVRILNRWKLNKVVNKPAAVPASLQVNSSLPTKTSSEKAVWKDGHVFDFGE